MDNPPHHNDVDLEKSVKQESVHQMEGSASASASAVVPIPSYSPPSILGKHARDETDKQSTPNPTPTKLFRCGDCDKSYSRVDHLARHVRLHTQERPYACDVCGKTFARADLLKRHAAGHNNPDGRVKVQGKVSNRQGRVGQACEACAELHLKCENEKPCTRCRTKGIYCQHQAGQSETESIARNLLSLAQQSGPVNGTPPTLFQGDALTTPSETLQTPMDAFDSQGVAVLDAAPSTDHHVHFAEFPPSYSATAQYDDPMVFDPSSIETMDSRMVTTQVTEDTSPHGDFDGVELREFLQDVMGLDAMAMPSSGLKSGTWTPRDILDFGVDTNLELNEIDLGFLDEYNQHNPFGIAATPEPSVVQSVASDAPSDPPLGVDAFQSSAAWKFRPVDLDNSSANLSLPPTDLNKRFHVEKRITSEPLSYTIRDQIIAMIAKIGPENRSFLSFPSLELLDSLLQYFISQSTATTYLIHMPTFLPSQNRYELCAAMISAGAALTPDASLRKLGYVFQETLRLHVPLVLERNNILIRDMQVLQASIMGLKIGFWSGNSRKMELAESFVAPFATMIRRRVSQTPERTLLVTHSILTISQGWFGRRYETIVPFAEDEGAVLEEKWHRWVELEIRKRLVFFIFQHDAQVSLTRFINPNISYAEVCLPLPAPKNLWTAKTALAWKSAFLAKPHHAHPIPSMLDLLQDIDRYVMTRDVFDSDIATEALLNATWGLIHEHRQQWSITSSAPNQWNNGTILLSSRLTELKRLLECLRMGLASDSARMRIPIEALSMHLHLSLEEVHLFAGVEGPDEARRVYPNLREWVRTHSARQAVWHAGQIVKFARGVTGLRDVNVIAVYQAALTFWTFGVVSNANAIATGNVGADTPNSASGGGGGGGGGSGQGGNEGGRSSDDATVLLNGNDDLDVQRFIALNRGRPGISVPVAAAGVGGSGSATANGGSAATLRKNVLLSEPEAVMSSLMDMIKTNHRNTQSRPPLVENLLELMGGLRSAVASSV